MFDYPVDLAPASKFAAGETGFVVSFPDVPEAHTQGDTREEALANAIEALEVALSFYVDGNKALPKPSPRRGRPVVRTRLIVTMKLRLYQLIRDKHIRKSDLARKLHWHRPQVDRLLDLTHDSRVDQLEAAFRALGQRVDVEMKVA